MVKQPAIGTSHRKMGLCVYEYQPSNVLKGENWLLLWDRTILTDQTVEANRPDIVLKDKARKKVELEGEAR